MAGISGGRVTEIQLRPGTIVTFTNEAGMVITGEVFKQGSRPMLRIPQGVKVSTLGVEARAKRAIEGLIQPPK